MAQQEIGHSRVKLFGAHRHGVQVGQHRAVAVRLGKIAVIVPGADGAAMTQMVVAGDQNAPPGKVFCQRLIAVDELHHAVGQLQNWLSPRRPARSGRHAESAPAQWTGR